MGSRHNHVLKILKQRLAPESYHIFYPVYPMAFRRIGDKAEGVQISLDVFTRESVARHIQALVSCHFASLIKRFQPSAHAGQETLYETILNEDCKQVLLVVKQFMQKKEDDKSS